MRRGETQRLPAFWQTRENALDRRARSPYPTCGRLRRAPAFYMAQVGQPAVMTDPAAVPAWRSPSPRLRADLGFAPSPRRPQSPVRLSACLCCVASRTARGPAWPVRASATEQAPGSDFDFTRRHRASTSRSSESEMPASFRCRSARCRLRLCPLALERLLPPESGLGVMN